MYLVWVGQQWYYVVLIILAILVLQQKRGVYITMMDYSIFLKMVLQQKQLNCHVLMTMFGEQMETFYFMQVITNHMFQH